MQLKSLVAAICVGVGAVTAGCSSQELAVRSPTAASPLTVAERRVGDASGDGSDCEPGQECSFVLMLTAQGSDTMSVCQPSTICSYVGTGRFEGVGLDSYAGGGSAVEFGNGEILVKLVLKLPKRGNQKFLVSGALPAQISSRPAPGCPDGVENVARFSGVLNHLGPVEGIVTQCRLT